MGIFNFMPIVVVIALTIYQYEKLIKIFTHLLGYKDNTIYLRI